jgi:hypothetical protein
MAQTDTQDQETRPGTHAQTEVSRRKLQLKPRRCPDYFDEGEMALSRDSTFRTSCQEE